MEEKSKRNNNQLFTFLKGMAMGAADIVPGVSGGTIAFITGIYDDLLDAITAVNVRLVKDLPSKGVKYAWEKINGSFILPLVIGIFLSVFLLASKISSLLENEPVLLWSFFLGLVFASIFYVGSSVTKWNINSIIGLVLGGLFAYYISSLPPLGQSDSLIYIFFCGMIAISAMILPGISGSFILLILGAYQTVIGALKDFNITIIAVFGLGCIVGLLSFSKALKWMLNKHRNVTIAILTGFLVGSLNKLWPWKKNEQLLYTHSDGKQDFFQVNVMPEQFVGDPQIMQAVLLMVVGIGVILSMEILARKIKK